MLKGHVLFMWSVMIMLKGHILFMWSVMIMLKGHVLFMWSDMIMLKSHDYVEGSWLIYVFRVCCVKWCPTSIEYRSNMKGVLEEPGTA
jgi:hypothetical protein